MLNRVINGVKEESRRNELIDKLIQVIEHPMASNIEKEEANGFLEFQLKE